jgi:hypothetical protein
MWWILLLLAVVALLFAVIGQPTANPSGRGCKACAKRQESPDT